jgi:hypothetical protein
MNLLIAATALRAYIESYCVEFPNDSARGNWQAVFDCATEYIELDEDAGDHSEAIWMLKNIESMGMIENMFEVQEE